jgi:hypothetical protein
VATEPAATGSFSFTLKKERKKKPLHPEHKLAVSCNLTRGFKSTPHLDHSMQKKGTAPVGKRKTYMAGWLHISSSRALSI